MDHWTPPPAEDTLAQSQAMLFAAALFIACTIFDAQNGTTHFPWFQQATPVASKAVRTAPAHAAIAADDQRLFTQAVRLYHAGAWSAAYGRFTTLADRGEPRSARIALAMWRDGPGVYKTTWNASPAQLQAWMRAAGGAAPPVLISQD